MTTHLKCFEKVFSILPGHMVDQLCLQQQILAGQQKVADVVL
jgi:hypothetical protein